MLTYFISADVPGAPGAVKVEQTGGPRGDSIWQAVWDRAFSHGSPIICYILQVLEASKYDESSNNLSYAVVYNGSGKCILLIKFS